MDLLSTNCWPRAKSCTLHLRTAFRFLVIGRGLSCSNGTLLKISTRICCNQIKKCSRKEKHWPSSPSSGTAYIQDQNKIFSSNTTEIDTSVIGPSRNDVLRACTITCGLVGALGVLIRQLVLNYGILSWLWDPFYSCHQLFLLLKIWPDFAKSSETANQLVLTSLEPLDYLVVAFLPGISEELLFLGVLLPLFVTNWTSIFAVAALFGILHLGGGRNYSFEIWATFVGLVYGYATILTSSATVPMASHALNNLVGGIIWGYQRGLVDESS